MKKVKKRNLTVLGLVIGLVTILFFYSQLNNQYEFTITHLFYIPVILGAFWLKYMVFWIVFYLSSLFLVSHLIQGQYSLLFADTTGFLFLLFCGLSIAYLKDDLFRLIGLKKYKKILSSIQEPVAIIDRDNLISIKNEMFSIIFGGDCRDLTVIKNNLDGKTKIHFEKLIEKAFSGESNDIHVYLADKRNITRYYEINFYPLKEKGKNVSVVLNFRDQTEIQNAQSELQLSVERQRVIIDILELLNNNQSEPLIIENMLDVLRRDTGVGLLGIRLIQGLSVSVSGDSAFDSKFIEFAEKSCWLFSSDKKLIYNDLKGFCRETIGEYVQGDNDNIIIKPFMCNDLVRYSKDNDLGICKFIDSTVVKSFLAIPLRVENKLIGYIFSVDASVNAYSAETMKLLDIISPSISIALGRMKHEKELHASVEEKELLVKEVHHRVKNNMQIISSLISLQSVRHEESAVRDALCDCQNRVRTMALVHEKIYKSTSFEHIDMAAYIQKLVSLLMSSYGISEKRVKVVLNVSMNYININNAIPLAQLINELVTNSFKYAFPDEGTGELEISLFKEGKSDCVLVLRDTGPGFGEDNMFPEGGNLGFQLISALTKQLNGTVEVFQNNGTTFKIYFPEDK